ncbi:thymidylate kinase [Neorickettsia helminthoeca str. Oregon]|uniref:Thymidylate kinase n=1 Tax=Neorickettsia helminthoeca str. Oregon TaxID=1286528 RepID=X5H461_9RICK|nr:dTMP kinase [Neorickettsia helminthoeca]AHX11468.1 thymidylate kinase [Neorickettsia helminthoeca str. Oregon]
MFIVFEGVDGAGKSTQMRRLEDFLRNRGFPCICTREPGGTPSAEKFRSVILHDSTLDPLSRLLLIIAARIEHCNKVIFPALERGKVVICDRFIYSTLAYQGYGEGIDPQMILDLHKMLGCIIDVDLTILLAPPRKRRVGRDNFERMSEDYFNRVLNGYEEIARQYDNIHLINRMGINQTHSEIVKVVQQKISEK